MAQKQPQIVTIDNVEYDLESMTKEQRILLDHTFDLDRKIASAQWNAAQMQVGRDAFFAMLKESLTVKSAPESTEQ